MGTVHSIKNYGIMALGIGYDFFKVISSFFIETIKKENSFSQFLDVALKTLTSFESEVYKECQI